MAQSCTTRPPYRVTSNQDAIVGPKHPRQSAKICFVVLRVGTRPPRQPITKLASHRESNPICFAPRFFGKSSLRPSDVGNCCHRRSVSSGRPTTPDGLPRTCCPLPHTCTPTIVSDRRVASHQKRREHRPHSMRRHPESLDVQPTLRSRPGRSTTPCPCTIREAAA